MFCNYRKYSEHRIVLRIFPYISFLLLAAAGCGDKSTQFSMEYLVKVNDRSISVEAFNSRYEAISAEFPISEQDDPGTEKVMKLRLLQQLVEELILLERAEELKLSISDSELAIAVEEIQADYPEGEFEQVLLEQAISFETWRAQLRKRLLKEKVVRNDLEASMALTPEEISASYNANYQTQEGKPDSKVSEKDMDENVIKFVRRQKAQDAYQVWLKDLQKKYTVHIDETAWKEIVGSS